MEAGLPGRLGVRVPDHVLGRGNATGHAQIQLHPGQEDSVSEMRMTCLSATGFLVQVSYVHNEKSNSRYRGSYISTRVLLNSSNEFGENKVRGFAEHLVWLLLLLLYFS